MRQSGVQDYGPFPPAAQRAQGLTLAPGNELAGSTAYLTPPDQKCGEVQIFVLLGREACTHGGMLHSTIRLNQAAITESRRDGAPAGRRSSNYSAPEIPWDIFFRVGS